MKLEITERVRQKRIVDVDFPYYYKHDLMLDESDSVIYGKIEERRHTQIQITFCTRFSERSFELTVSLQPAETLSCYMTDEHISSEAEYADAKKRLLDGIHDAV